ncbi:MAG: aspartyl-tRNA synthetase [Solirubrobacterales bacterium]|jgi:aspartyl-tRNA synthetase|nr:aspartyl-tRNA synthetase [Solirubrobacterales bacterium]
MTELPPPRPNGYRDSWCGQVLEDRVDADVRLAGWVHRRRDHGGLVFIDLRDRTGLVQLVFNPDEAGDAHELGHRLRAEDVISVAGKVVRRSEETVNSEIPTGAFEVRVAAAELLADAETPPFEIESFSGEVGEETRLRHRYLDLRRERMRDAIVLRHRMTTAMREFLAGEGFLEIETPMLSRSTPEGARDFLVPSRLQQGSFYALPQSPQLFKQLLMVAGFERYFQIVRCFRDEDQRADRQPDFTQLDIEMSFVGVEDVLDANERLLAHVLGTAGIEVSLPLPRISYDEAISRYGSDAPDTRFGLQLRDLTEVLRGTEFKAFGGVIDSGGAVLGLNAGKRELSRAELDGLIGEAQDLGAKGLVWAFRESGEPGWRSPIAKFLSPQEIEAMSEQLAASEGDLLLLVADERKAAYRVLGLLRERLGARFELIPEGVNELAWVIDWPLFEWNADEDRWDPLHHPFTQPEGELDPADPGAARALAYDIVWNGVEIGGGSIRINRPDVQRQAFEAIGIGAVEAEDRFGFLLDALRYGAPPHGGIAYGLDRMVALAHGVDSIRDVIAFPKSASGADPLTGAPAPVDEAQLRELGLQRRAKP